MGAAAVLEEGDVGRRRATGAAGDQVVQVAEHVGAGDHAASQRVLELADVVESGVEAVDEDASAFQRRVVGLAHVGAVGADQVEVLAGAEPIAAQHRLGGQRGGGDDVGGGDRLRQIGDGLGAGAPVNLEVDIVARYVLRFMEVTGSSDAAWLARLEKAGFV